ncbi:MAG: Usg family protein [Rhodospirillales bacterium]|jgi:uncharacterized protein Usg|nr:Usg family protein [Rhodospirillales bacterium]|tara:strand:- start:392 stop:655 length:264 start_codon:yes stop_codon:yes gene_type:complete
MANLERRLAGYRLTTAEILYHLPDHPVLLQSFVWQFLDLAPRYPELHKFLEFWDDNIEGRIHSVEIMCGETIAPARFGHVAIEARLH